VLTDHKKESAVSSAGSSVARWAFGQWRHILISAFVTLFAVVVALTCIAVVSRVPNPNIVDEILEASTATNDYRYWVLKMKLRSLRDDPSRPYEPLEKIHKEMRERMTDLAESMPPGEEGMNLLCDASEYFEGDFFDIWVSCRTTAYNSLGEAGIKCDPKEVLEASLKVMRQWGDADLKPKVKFRSFGGMYERRRFEEKLSHRDAVVQMMEEVYQFQKSKRDASK
jgi:hypothetical protein